MTISQRIFKIMKEKKLKQTDLAEYIGIKDSSVSDWKNKDAIPTADKIVKISEFLNVSLEYLLKGEEPTQQNINSGNVTISGTGAQAQNCNISIQEISGLQKEMLETMEKLPKQKQIELIQVAYKMTEE